MLTLLRGSGYSQVLGYAAYLNYESTPRMAGTSLLEPYIFSPSRLSKVNVGNVE